MRWIHEAEKKLSSAEYLINGGFYDISCLMSYLTANLALTQLMELRGQFSYTPSLVYLINRVSEGKTDVIHSARILESYSLPLRMPLALPEGTPSEYIDKPMAEEALRHAKAILEFVKGEMG